MSKDRKQAVDIGMLISLVGENKDRHCKLFQSFIDATPGIIQAIQAAHEAHSAEMVRQQSHKLKSSARSMGADELADVCQALEVAGKEEQWDEIDRMVPRLETLYADVLVFIENYCHPGQEADGLPVEQSISVNEVLLIDDDEVILNIIMMMLNEMGIKKVSKASTGADALSVLKQAHDIDIVICDLNMPEMDGIEFLRHLADIGFSGSVILASGEDMRILKTTEKLVIEHKLDLLGVMQKPIKPAELKHLLGNKKLTSIKQQSGTGDKKSFSFATEEFCKGIEHDEFVTYYQPKIDVRTRKVVGVETLVRWNHPEKGMVPPYFFISFAEENNLIDALTRIIFKLAVQHASSLQAAGYDIKFAINISVETLNDLNLPDYAYELTKDAGVNPMNIILEVTESRLMKSLTSALEILIRLNMKKFKLSVDDFGTGYSSLEQLQRVPFSEMKIDRAFVHGAAGDKSACTILQSSVELAKRLGLSVVAEGVENQEDWDLIEELGCDEVQGYFVAKPMPFDELKLFLDNYNNSLLKNSGGSTKL